jgi:peptide chain release factor 2
LAGKEDEITRLTEQSAAADFWDDPTHAQGIMQRLTALQAQVDEWRGIAAQARDLQELLELAEAEDNAEVEAEVERETRPLLRLLDRKELALVLSGPHDSNNALLSVLAREGGVEAQDWGEMLLRMYTRWGETRGWKVDLIDLTEGDEAGIKSATLAMRGTNAYGYAKAEAGTHRLVRNSPFDAARRRHTSFALVEVMPELDDDIEVNINPDDLKVDVYKSAGAGGQNVQKNSTAIRLTHLPTGIVVTCQNERSQLQNREFAMKILRGKLWELEERKRAEEAARLKGEHVSVGWGSQIRNYVLQPYQLVKDLRTGQESTDPQSVLNGEIDPFIDAWLRWQLTGATGLAAVGDDL